MQRSIPIIGGAFFVCCMVCHGELARRRPHPRHLTLFYLIIAAGGALGGLFTALVAPRLFPSDWEESFGLVLCAALATIAIWRAGRETLLEPLWPRVTRSLLGATTLTLALFSMARELESARTFRVRMRNFYGVLKVRDQTEAGLLPPHRALLNGTIRHGLQLSSPERRNQPNSYFGPASGIGRALAHLQSRGPVRAGILGLGAGVLASHCRPGDHFRFYEINPLDERIARTEFTFLAACADACDVVLGDGRLALERGPAESFDLLAMDAFASDAVPVHLLTREAFALYFQHLKAGGILAVHISNRYVDLTSVVAAGATHFGKTLAIVRDEGDSDPIYSPSTWALIADSAAVFQSPSFIDGDPELTTARPGFRPWTDDESNVIGVLK